MMIMAISASCLVAVAMKCGCCIIPISRFFITKPNFKTQPSTASAPIFTLQDVVKSQLVTASMKG